MKRVQRFSLVVGFGTILASGIAFADDVVKRDILPGSSIRVGTHVVSFGQDPPTSTLNNASITDDGTGAGLLFVAQATSVSRRPRCLFWPLPSAPNSERSPI
jgi:hypothetical protein